MRLYGLPICTSCKQAMMLLGRTPLEWMYIDVAVNPVYTGDVPALELEDGALLIGLPRIHQYIRQLGF